MLCHKHSKYWSYFLQVTYYNLFINILCTLTSDLLCTCQGCSRQKKNKKKTQCAHACSWRGIYRWSVFTDPTVIRCLGSLSLLSRVLFLLNQCCNVANLHHYVQHGKPQLTYELHHLSFPFLSLSLNFLWGLVFLCSSKYKFYLAYKLATVLDVATVLVLEPVGLDRAQCIKVNQMVRMRTTPESCFRKSLLKWAQKRTVAFEDAS